MAELEISQLSIEEYEAMRLYDVDGLDQSRAAEMMNISRPTFGRIIASAHKKVAEALAYGKAIKISGGSYHFPPGPGFGPGLGGGRGGRGGGRRMGGRNRT